MQMQSALRGAHFTTRGVVSYRSCKRILTATFLADTRFSSKPVTLPRRVILAAPLLSTLAVKTAMADTRGAMKWETYPDSDQQYVVLNNGLKMPLLGLGTSGGKGEQCQKAVQHALLKGGYKHIDTAGMYGNEDAVGRGIKVVDRQNVFITSKLKNEDHGRVEEAVKEQLKELQTDYIDLYLIHWPVSTGVKNGDVDPPIKETWQAMEKLYEQGILKSIGVSNFSVKKLKDVQSYARIQPAVNQVEVHVWHRNIPIVEYSLQSGVQIQAYSPMGGTPNWEKDPPNTDPTVIEIAKKYSKTPNQHGSCVIPKSVTPSRIDENAGIWDWSLSKEDYDTLSSIKFQVRMCDGEKQGFVEAGPYKSKEDLWDGEA